MKSPADCLEELKNGEHDNYPYTTTLLEWINAEIVEGLLRSICLSVEHGSSADQRLFGKSLGKEINDAMVFRAGSISAASVTPFDNDTNEADINREK